MTQPNILELAKQGDAKAIALLLNRQLQAKGITAAASLKDGCLQVMLEAAEAPSQQVLAPWVSKSIAGLGAASIEKVKVYGRQTGAKVPAWSQEFEVAGLKLPVTDVTGGRAISSENTESNELSLKERAKLGDVEAIASLLNLPLQNKGITATASLQDGCLQVMLEGDRVPDEEASIRIVRRELMNLKAGAIASVKVYGQQAGEDFPAWNREFELVARASQSSHNLGVNTTNQLSANNSYAEITQDQSLIQIINKTSTELLSDNQWNVAFIILSVIAFLMISVNFTLAVILAIAASIAYVKYQNTPTGKAATAKRQLEALQKAEEGEQERLRQEEQKRILIEMAQSESKLLTTNLAHTALDEFRKVNARLSVGVNYMDLSGVITPAKFATQKFEKSKDYNVCPYLSELISKNMLYYEISQECFQQKVAHKPLNSQFKATLQAEFPELKGLIISFSSDSVISKIWQKAYRYSDEIEKILESSDNLSG
jgi:TusA-related sulfurtransferase